MRRGGWSAAGGLYKIGHKLTRHTICGLETYVRDYQINIFYSEEDGAFVADVPDLEACSAVANTPEEALA